MLAQEKSAILEVWKKKRLMLLEVNIAKSVVDFPNWLGGFTLKKFESSESSFIKTEVVYDQGNLH